MQYASKGLCVAKTGATVGKTCIDALVAAGVTHPMPASYMVEWADEVAAKSLSELPASSRHARALDYATCVELSGNLREGRFPCASATAEKIAKVTPKGDVRAEVQYVRTIAPRAWLESVAKACPGLVRPTPSATTTLVKREKKWVVPDEGAAAAAPAGP